MREIRFLSVVFAVFVMIGLSSCMVSEAAKSGGEPPSAVQEPVRKINPIPLSDGSVRRHYVLECDTFGEPEQDSTECAVSEFEAREQSDGSVYLGVFRCTAYCPCWECSEGYGRATATGATARANHTVAVDPSVIPYGTHLLIDGVEYVAEDCGGGVRGNSIDIFFDTHAETYNWGLRYKDVYIIR